MLSLSIPKTLNIIPLINDYKSGSWDGRRIMAMAEIPEGFPEPYTPGPLPPKDIDLSVFFDKSLGATEAISRYDGILHNMVNPDLILATLTPREAVLSSKIEGTIATLEEVMLYDAQQPPRGEEVRNEVMEVHNYIRAMRQAIIELNKKPLCTNTICTLHSILLTDVRGRDRQPGEVRRSQNYVRTKHGRFTPPQWEVLREYLDEWEIYLHRFVPNWLVQLALLKAQFELLHPFLDGNGRIGRMLVPLILYDKKHIKSPTFYISEYFTKNEDAYYESLFRISQDGDWNGWINFFLQAITDQSEANINKAIAINRLYDNTKDVTRKLRLGSIQYKL